MDKLLIASPFPLSDSTLRAGIASRIAATAERFCGHGAAFTPSSRSSSASQRRSVAARRSWNAIVNTARLPVSFGVLYDVREAVDRRSEPAQRPICHGQRCGQQPQCGRRRAMKAREHLACQPSPIHSAGSP
jgi:hypothetical protein